MLRLSAILLLILAAGCNPFAVAPSAELKQSAATLRQQGANLRGTITDIRSALSNITRIVTASAMTAEDKAAVGEQVETIAAATETQENVATAVTGEAKRLEKLATKVDAPTETPQERRMNWAIVAAVVMYAVAAGALTKAQFGWAPALAVGLGTLVVLAKAVLLIQAWFVIGLLLVATGAGAWLILETILRKYRGRLSWGQAFIKAILTTPAQDIQDAEAGLPKRKGQS